MYIILNISQLFHHLFDSRQQFNCNTYNSLQLTIAGFSPGLYEVVLTCFDVAGNHRSARRIFVFDDSSSISVIASNPLLAIGKFLSSLSSDPLLSENITGISD